MLCALPGQLHAQGAKKILSIEAYDMLNTVPDTYLIDVRTRAEYQLIGHPFRAYLFPYMFWTEHLTKKDDTYTYQLGLKNKAFVEEISKVFKKTDNLLIMGQDGTRSHLAAKEPRISSLPISKMYSMWWMVLKGLSSPALWMRIGISFIASWPREIRSMVLDTGGIMGGSGGDYLGPMKLIPNMFIPLI
jgi:hypothetical protein